MRYFLLCMCLTFSMLAQARNEEFSPVAFNPSRLGAYEYLKVNKSLTLMGGLNAPDASTEINLYGEISVQDHNASSHSKPNTPTSFHQITTIKPLSNYALDNQRRTAYGPGSWIQNFRALTGKTTLSSTALIRAMGETGNTFGYTFSQGTTPVDNYLIKNVYVYGYLTENEAQNTPAIDGNMFVKSIKQMSVSASAIQSQAPSTPMLSLETRNLISPNSQGVNITENLYLGDVAVEVSSLSKCSTNTYEWKERITDNNQKVRILACK